MKIMQKTIFLISMVIILVFPAIGSADNWCANATRRWNEIREAERAYLEARECKNVELKLHELDVLTSEMLRRCSSEIGSFVQVNSELQKNRNEILTQCRRRQSSPFGHN
jgi:hypothetical protein